MRNSDLVSLKHDNGVHLYPLSFSCKRRSMISVCNRNCRYDRARVRAYRQERADRIRLRGTPYA